MALSNHERVGKALDLLRSGLAPFVEREVSNYEMQVYTLREPQSPYHTESNRRSRSFMEGDASTLINRMMESWNDVFMNILGTEGHNLLTEIRDWRNKWARQESFSSDDADRALDSMARLLTSVSASQAEDVQKMKMELRRLIFDEQVRNEKRKMGGTLIEAASTGSLKPWREVITPHADVAGGRYQQAEFAADLWQVHLGEGSDEYRTPGEFFRRTYLTESLKKLLVNGLLRLSGRGGDPVVQLQTNFGGGKTHSMLALYHLCSGLSAAELSGVEDVLGQAGVASIPAARRVVLVGNKISPGNPVTKSDGTVVRTLWGELAWQLGGPEAYAVLKADDENATNPGDRLRELFLRYSPCLVLIDEWVAYARQLHDQGDLPAGNFETQFTFAQTLSEAASAVDTCMLVISLPASEGAGSPHTLADDAEVGGVRGREALARLRNVIGRLETSWRPATAEEGFEIVRRRLFDPLSGQESYTQRNVTARAFSEFYQSQAAAFPSRCRESDYERRIQAAYPIHPEVFDQLYGRWSTLVKFQRTRGVLRLMATVIHTLWDKGDQSPLILPAMIPIDDPRVQAELTRYLSDNWTPIIDTDVDGENALPLRIDREVTQLGRLSATRRVARSIYLGSAPLTATAHRGVEGRQVMLGCALPGESPATFGDALRRLAERATYLYQDNTHYWYDTQPTVTKLAEDRAAQYARHPEKVAQELQKRLQEECRTRGDFDRIHVLPQSGAEVLDARETRLVVLSDEATHARQGESVALAEARAILESRGTAPRLYRNTLVFLAADSTRVTALHEAIQKSLAWESILAEKDRLNLSPHQVRQAETQHVAANATVRARLPETYCWLLVPEQPRPMEPMQFAAIRLSSTEPLAVRASRKLISEERMIKDLGPSILRTYLDEVPLWKDDHIAVNQLVEYFATYLYLPRLRDPKVLQQAITNGIGLLTWRQDSFAYADGYDEERQRYTGLRVGQVVEVHADNRALLVRSEVAIRQIAAETAPSSKAEPEPERGEGRETEGGGTSRGNDPEPSPPGPVRFHGAVTLDPLRIGYDAGRIGEEVVRHLLNAKNGEVTIVLEISARIPEGANDRLVRTVTENCRELKYDEFGFEKE